MKEGLIAAINETVEVLKQSGELEHARAAATRSEKALRALRIVVEQWRLLTYLPGVCEVCSRIEL